MTTTQLIERIKQFEFNKQTGRPYNIHIFHNESALYMPEPDVMVDCYDEMGLYLDISGEFKTPQAYWNSCPRSALIECSHCHFVWDKESGTQVTADVFRYCPHCGSYMQKGSV